MIQSGSVFTIHGYMKYDAYYSKDGIAIKSKHGMIIDSIQGSRRILINVKINTLNIIGKFYFPFEKINLI